MTTKTPGAVGQVVVRLFGDGGMELEFDVDDADRVELLNAASAALASVSRRISHDERVSVACTACGAVATGYQAAASSPGSLVPCGHRADIR